MKTSTEAWDHLTEVRNALAGVKNQLKKLSDGIDNGTFSGDVLEKAKEMRSNLQKQYDEVNSYLNNQAKKAEGTSNGE